LNEQAPPTVVASGDAPRLIGTKVVALFDANSGRIHHLHTTYVYEGAKEPSDEELVERAARHARRLGHEPEELESIVSVEPRHGLLPHRIDITTNTFVALESSV
jgi:pantoate kinase